MNQEYLNKEKLANGVLYSKIIYRKKYFEYWWNDPDSNLDITDIKVEDVDWKKTHGQIGWIVMDKWKNIKGEWISDEELDYNNTPILKKLFINNLITFERKLKLEKLLKS